MIKCIKQSTAMNAEGITQIHSTVLGLETLQSVRESKVYTHEHVNQNDESYLIRTGLCH